MIDVPLVHLKAEYDVILRLVMDQGRSHFQCFMGIGNDRQFFVVDVDQIYRIFCPVAVLGYDNRQWLAHVVNFSHGQSSRSRPLQDRFHAFEPWAGMNFEALREKSDSVVDITAGPDSGNTFHLEGFPDIDIVNPRMSASASQKSGMKHVRQANIAHVDAASGEKAARLVRFKAAADEWG